MTPQRIFISEAEYIDPRAGNDKFYRVFAFGSTWISQYGRSGAIGTFTKPVQAASEEEARSEAAKKFASKIKKGYTPTRSGELLLNEEIDTQALTRDRSALAALDTLAQQLPVSGASGNPTIIEPIQPVTLDTEPRADLTGDLIAALHHHTSRPSIPDDLTPPLPVRPMLASVQPEDVLTAAMQHPEWVAQFKYDGDRVVIEAHRGALTVYNRAGQTKVRNIGHAHLEPLTALHSGRWIVDGEVVGRTLVLFDLLTATDGTTTWADEHYGFDQRYAVLETLCRRLGIPLASSDGTQHDAVVLAPVARSADERADYLSTAVAQQREGIILRHRDGLYEPGRRSTTLVKHKLIKDADVVISGLHSTKESATLSVYDQNGQLIEVGAASTIGKTSPQVGQVWKVTFLYVTNPEHPRLYQPRLVSRREDKPAGDCLLDQFADAGTSKHV